jgi:hypothetical protein
MSMPSNLVRLMEVKSRVLMEYLSILTFSLIKYREVYGEKIQLALDELFLQE